MGGQVTYGRLTVLGLDPANKRKFLVRCECGVEKTTDKYAVMDGRTASCGCLRREVTAERALTENVKHGLSYTKEYSTWASMNQRCADKANPHYGARGIVVCDRWKNSVHAFIEDMGPAPSQAHSIDRIDNDGDYEPDNCQWATKDQQLANRRVSRFLSIGGVRKTIAEWVKETGALRRTVADRLSKGWSDEEALYGRKGAVGK